MWGRDLSPFDYYWKHERLQVQKIFHVWFSNSCKNDNIGFIFGFLILVIYQLLLGEGQGQATARPDNKFFF